MAPTPRSKAEAVQDQVSEVTGEVAALAAMLKDLLPGVLALAALTFLLALVQVGPLVTGAIATFVLFAQGDSLAALLVLLWFLVVVTSVDNLIRPLIAARSIAMPGYLAFLGALGGVLSFGLIGVFTGPVVVTLLFRIAQSWVGLAASR